MLLSLLFWPVLPAAVQPSGLPDLHLCVLMLPLLRTVERCGSWSASVCKQQVAKDNQYKKTGFHGRILLAGAVISAGLQDVLKGGLQLLLKAPENPKPDRNRKKDERVRLQEALVSNQPLGMVYYMKHSKLLPNRAAQF